MERTLVHMVVSKTYIMRDQAIAILNALLYTAKAWQRPGIKKAIEAISKLPAPELPSNNLSGPACAGCEHSRSYCTAREPGCSIMIFEGKVVACKGRKGNYGNQR